MEIHNLKKVDLKVVARNLKVVARFCALTRILTRNFKLVARTYPGLYKWWPKIKVVFQNLKVLGSHATGIFN